MIFHVHRFRDSIPWIAYSCWIYWRKQKYTFEFFNISWYEDDVHKWKYDHDWFQAYPIDSYSISMMLFLSIVRCKQYTMDPNLTYIQPLRPVCTGDIPTECYFSLIDQLLYRRQIKECVEYASTNISMRAAYVSINWVSFGSRNVRPTRVVYREFS